MDPILDPEDQELERSLLNAGRDVGMTSDMRAKTLAALAAGTVGVTAAGTAKAGTWSWLTTKTAAVLTAGAVLAGGAVAVTVSSSTPDQAPPPKAVLPTETTDDSEGSATEEPEPTQTAEEEPRAEKAPPKQPVPPKTPAKNTPSKDSAGTLGDELAHIGKVEAALRGGNPQKALTLLSEYRTRFRKRRLGLEAEILTIQAMHESGSVGAARSRAERFVKAHPTSPLNTRAKKYLK